MTRATSIVAVLLLLATILAYAPAFRAPYEFDDIASIPGNASIQSLNPAIALHPPDNTSVSGRPLVNYSFAIGTAVNRAFGVDVRPDPYGPNKTVVHHLGNLKLHLLCALLLFLVLRREASRELSLAVTTLWILHPIQSEAVNYLVQRTELLASACYLAVLVAATRAWDAERSASRWRWTAASLFAFVAGAASKETIITVPLVILLHDLLLRGATWQSEWKRPDRRVLYATLGILVAVRVVMLTAGARSGTVGLGLGMAWYEYLYSQGWAIAQYLRLALWPHDLALDYGYQPIRDWRGAAGGLLVLFLMVATVVAWRRNRRLAFLGCAFFLLLAPSSSVVPITTEIAAERRMYLALAPVLVAVLLAAGYALRRLRSASRMSGVVAIALACATLTGFRSRLYQDPEALWRDAVAHASGNARAYDNLAATMFYHDPPRLNEAQELYERAIALDSTYVHAYTGLASIAVNESRLPDAERILLHVLAIQPGYSDAVAHLGQLYLRMQQPAKAIPYLAQFAKAFPSDNAYLALGRAQLQAGQLDEARSSLIAALARNPDRTDVMHYLGGLLAERGQGAQAIPLLERTISSGHGTPVDVGLLALAYAEAGRATDAAEAAQAAAAQAAGDAAVFVLAGRAMLLAGHAKESAPYFAEARRLDRGK